MKSPNSSAKSWSARTRHCPSLNYSPVGGVKAGVLGEIRPPHSRLVRRQRPQRSTFGGRLATREYEAKDGSGKRYRTEIVARQIREHSREAPLSYPVRRDSATMAREKAAAVL